MVPLSFLPFRSGRTLRFFASEALQGETLCLGYTEKCEHLSDGADCRKAEKDSDRTETRARKWKSGTCWSEM